MERDWKCLSTIPFLRNFVIKGNANNRINPPFCFFPALLTPLSVTVFINQGVTGAVTEASKCGIIAARNPLTCIFIWSFTISVAPSINRPDFCNDSMILIILSIPSYEINKVNPLPALTTPSPLILFPSLSITFEVAYLGKLFLAKGIARSVNVFFPTLNQNYLNCWIYHKEINPI